MILNPSMVYYAGQCKLVYSVFTCMNLNEVSKATDHDDDDDLGFWTPELLRSSAGNRSEPAAKNRPGLSPKPARVRVRLLLTLARACMALSMTSLDCCRGGGFTVLPKPE